MEGSAAGRTSKSPRNSDTSADETRRTLAQGTYAAAVEADLEEARKLGAGGVPFFVIDHRFGVSGAQSTDVFVDVLTRAGGVRRS